MDELIMSLAEKYSIRIGDTIFQIESVFGDEQLDNLMEDYIIGKIKEETEHNKAAA